MRIVIDIVGDQVRVHRVIGDALPPPDLVEQASGLGAESAGIAMLPGGVAALGAAGVGGVVTDAGAAPRAPSARTTKSRSKTAVRRTAKTRPKTR